MEWDTLRSIILILLAFAIAVGLALIAYTAGASSGGGGACNIYCVIKDLVEPLPAPGMCSC